MIKLGVSNLDVKSVSFPINAPSFSNLSKGLYNLEVFIIFLCKQKEPFRLYLKKILTKKKGS